MKPCTIFLVSSLVGLVIRTIVCAREEFLGRDVYLFSELVRRMRDYER